MSPSIRFGVFGALATLALGSSSCSTSDDIGGVRDVEADLSAPDLSLPEPTVPELSLPELSLPELSLPELSLPELTVPELTVVDAAASFLFVAPSGDYTIEFPGEPTRTELPVPIDGETVVADAYLYEDASTAAYFTSVFDYPDVPGEAVVDAVLEGARDGAITSIGAVLESSSPVEQAGVAGIAFTFSIDADGQQGVGNAVVFFDDPRLYQSFALGEPAGRADYQYFVDTFEFTPAEAEQ